MSECERMCVCVCMGGGGRGHLATGSQRQQPIPKNGLHEREGSEQGPEYGTHRPPATPQLVTSHSRYCCTASELQGTAKPPHYLAAAAAAAGGLKVAR